MGKTSKPNQDPSGKKDSPAEKPVENPALLKAIEAFASGDSQVSQDNLARELRRAVFLVPILSGSSNTNSDQRVIGKESILKILTCTDETGAESLPLFTDWDEIHAWANRPVTTIIMPAADAWQFVLSQPHYAGVVVNPSGQSLPVSRTVVAYLASARK